jgi:TRAP-type mannitol/chloroaromatic compound transport system permease large subunit
MIPTLLFVAFLVMMLMGVPIGAALGLAGAACIALANSDAQWFGLLAVPQNFYAGLGKYPLLAIPMFVLVGSIFDRSGVAPACCRWWPSWWRCSWAASRAPARPMRRRWARS